MRWEAHYVRGPGDPGVGNCLTQGVGNYLIAPLGNCLTLEGFSLGNYLIADTSRSKAAALPPTGSRLNSAQRFADTCRAGLQDGHSPHGGIVYPPMGRRQYARP